MSEVAKPSAAAISSATAAQWPAIPVVASRCPGSGLAAGVLCGVRPSGNSTVFCKNAYGSSSAAGASAAASRPATRITTPMKRQTAWAQCRTATAAANTGIAGQAVAFIAQATPSVIAARNSPDGRAISASVRNISAMTGGSVMPTASGNAITGEAAKKTVDSVVLRRQPSQRRCGAAMVQAAQI